MSNQPSLLLSDGRGFFKDLVLLCSDAGAEQHGIEDATIGFIQDVFAAVNLRTPQHRDNR